jgi:acetyltransferase
VGVVGASANPEKRGHQVVAALQESGFRGPIYPVNPRGGEILGLGVSRSIVDIQDAPDLVYVATPAFVAPDVVRECGAAGVKGAVVPAVGFRESGDDGAALEIRMVEAARETGIRVVGPNTSGLLNTHLGLHMVGGEPLAPGALAIVSQSGNVALDLMTRASRRPVGVSIYVGPGNECDVGFDEILEFLAGHEPTRAIVLYLEGVRDGRALFDAARSVTRTKPIVVLKGGRSEAGVRSARSHTGSIAGPYEVFRAAARDSGMFEVEASDELFAVGETLATQPRASCLADGGFVVISDGGGHATLAADRFAADGVPLAGLSQATRTDLQELFGPAASVENPVDAAGAPDRDPSVLAAAARIAANDPACCGIMLSGLFGGYAIRFAESLHETELATANALAATASEGRVPLVVHSLYESRSTEPLTRLRDLGVPVFESLEIAVTCCRGLADTGQGARRTARRLARDSSAVSGWISEVEARTLVESHGVCFAEAKHCRSRGEVEALSGGSGRWAMKAVSAALPHKSEAGAVMLDVPDHDLADGFDSCVAAARSHLERYGSPGWGVEGVLVGPMLPAPIAELIVGVRRDPSFGPVATLGFGGVDVELAPDAVTRLLPLSGSDFEAMIDDLARGPTLRGYRGRPGVDLSGVEELLGGLAEALASNPDIAMIELNPVFAYPDRIIAVDAIARCSDPAERRN